MRRLSSYAPLLWSVNLILMIFAVGFFLWQDTLFTGVQDLHMKTEEIKQIHAKSAAIHQLRTRQAESLRAMEVKRFTKTLPGQESLQKALLGLAKRHHITRVRMEFGAKTRRANTHIQPITFFMEAPLDNDIRAFMEEVTHGSPWTMRWTFVTLFKTRTRTIQSELRGEFVTYAP